MSKAAQKLASSGEAEMNMTPMIDIVFNLLIFFMVVTDLKSKDLANLTLPVAHMAQEDKANDDEERIILNLDKEGAVHWKGQMINLDQLGTYLGTLRDTYEIKKRQRGESGLEELPGGGKASKLYILLRADKDTPWQHVQWLMTIMAEQKLYKLQFATKQFRDGFITPEEAKELDAMSQREYQNMTGKG